MLLCRASGQPHKSGMSLTSRSSWPPAGDRPLFWGATPTRSLKEDLWVRYQVTTSALRASRPCAFPCPPGLPAGSTDRRRSRATAGWSGTPLTLPVCSLLRFLSASCFCERRPNRGSSADHRTGDPKQQLNPVCCFSDSGGTSFAPPCPPRAAVNSWPEPPAWRSGPLARVTSLPRS